MSQDHRGCSCFSKPDIPLERGPTGPSPWNFFFLFNFIFNWRIITLQYCDDFCHTSTWISHRYTCVPPHPECLFYLPPHPIPLGCPRALALGALLHVLNLPWSSILHMMIYMFQCYSLKESHPCLLPLSPKVCSLIYWLFKSVFNVQNFVNLPVFPFFFFYFFLNFILFLNFT